MDIFRGAAASACFLGIIFSGLSETVQSELCGNIGALLEENGITAVKISAEVNNFSDGSISISKVTVNLSDGAEKDKTYKLLRDALGEDTVVEVKNERSAENES